MASRRRLVQRFAFASHAVHQHRRRPVLEVLEGRVVMSTFTVNSLGDAGIGSNDTGDLRYCINQANADDQANTIVFDPTVFGTPQTITLNSGQLELEDTLGTQTITGPAAGVTISGGGNSRVFEVDGGGVTASISGLTISGGSISTGDGGGLANYGTATLTDCTISGNISANGGGVINSGTANLIGCTVSDNTAYYRVFSGYNYYGGRTYITEGNGGGVDNSGTATLSGCTISGNSASFGGGVFNGGTTTLTNCTIAGNSAGTSGGGIEAQGTVTVTSSTFARNQAIYGGAIDNDSGRYTVTVGDSILAGDSAGTGPEFCNSVTSTGHNLVAETDGSSGWVSSDLTGTAAQPLNALLAVPGYYGGPTQTIALLPGSPALGAGIAVTGITTDQRGEPLDSPDPDIGAFQSQGFTLTAIAGSTPQSTATNTWFAVPLGVTIAANNPVEPVDGGVLTFTAPASGPSANLSVTTATIGHNGVASVTASANASAGSYAVTASAGGNGTDFDLTNTNGGLISMAFSGISDQTILVGTSSITISGALANGSLAPAGETAAVTLDGVQQWPTIGSGGAFSTTFNTAGLTVAGSPYTITYAYASDGTFASASATSTLTVKPTTPIILTVNSLGDAGIGSGDAGDLLYCIDQANADDGPNTIVFDPTVFGTPQTIALSGAQLELEDTLGTQTITGPAAGLTISAGRGSRVFQVDSGVTASISGLTITGGWGGGLANYGTATLTDCTISGNQAANGGGVINSGTANLIGCTVSDNTAAYGSPYIIGGNGGGVDNSGTATLTGCTISGNRASLLGGGVYNSVNANLAMSDCTVNGNTFDAYTFVSGGGGVWNSGTANLTACTFSGNFAGNGSGLFNSSSGTAVLTDTIVAGNTDPSGASDIGGDDVSGNYNLIGTGGSGGLVDGVDGNIVLTSLDNLDLTPLGDFGGPTQTMALLAGSPALGAGVIADYPGTTNPITTDQRGLLLDSPNPDIGAFQTQGSPLLVPSFSVSDQSITYGAPSVTISGTLADGAQAPVGETVAVTLDGVEQSATIGSGGAFSTIFATTDLTVPDSPYTVDYAYAYTSGASFASASATSMLTVNPTLITLTVDSLGDAGIGSGDVGDLLYCIDQANADDQLNTIVFDPTVFSTPQTITLSGGTLELENTWGTQTITGPAAGLTISGGGSSRVFQVDSGVTASISGLTITGGNGGGLANYGTATLTDCTLSGNSAANGGGVFNGGGANLTLTDCTLSGNSAAHYGGGVYNIGTANLTDCTVSGNSASGLGGGLYSFNYMLSLTDTIVAGNTNSSGASDIGGQTLVTGGNNLIGTGGSGGLVNGVDGNIVGVANPLLSALGNYGGPTQTMALLAGSPALGAGVIADYPGTTNPITTDQRGFPLDSPNPDIGAFQTQGSPLLGLTFSVNDQSITYGTPSVTISGTLADGAQAPVGETVAVTLDGVEQSATIGPGGAFSTTLDTADLTLPDSPYTITYAYATDGTFASESTTSMLTVNPILIALTVDSLGDAGIGSGDAGDLLYCIDQANADDQSNAIVFDPTVFSTPQTITLSGGELELENIWGTQTITGPAAGVTISGGGSSRVFQVDRGVTASISGLTISGGYSYSLGGGLFNQGTANISDCTLSGNSAIYGGGMFNDGTANISDCTLSGNISDGLTNLGSATLIGCTITGNDRGVVNTRTPYQNTADLVLINCTVNGNYGQGVANSALLSLTNCTISGNSGYSGGGLDNYGGLATLTGCTLSGNSGGGVSNTANLAMSDCTLSANSAPNGGGLYNGGSATLTDCTLSGNIATSGGGAVFNGQSAQSGFGYTYGSADLSLTDCTLSGNSAESGGGVYNTGSANLIACTLSGNSGGGLVNASGAVSLTDTLVAGNTNSSGASDIGGQTLVTGGNNLIGTGGSGGLVNGVDGNIVGVANPLLAALANNGGPTQTMALLDGSPAIGAGIAVTVVTADQRGEPLDSPTPDIGAFQTQGSQLIELNFSVSNQNITYGTSSVTVSGTLANGSQALAGETVAVTLDGVEQSATIGSGGAFSTTFDTTGLTVASSPDTITYAYTSDGTFASESTTSTLTVDPARLTITANPETKVYGTAGPALAYTASGFQFNDTAGSVLTGALAWAQAGTLAGEQAGGYAIGQGTLAADSNYTISFTGNTLTITPAPLTVTANARTKVYGHDDPALTDTLAGLVDQTVDGVTIDDTAASVVTGTLARAQSGTLAGEPVGDYAITQGTLAANSNYTITFTAGTLTITPAPLTVAANPQTKDYGDEDPALTVTPTGLVDTTVDGVAIDDIAATVLTGAPARAKAGTLAGEQVGDYAIDQGTLAAKSNYTLSFTGGSFAITPAALSVAANPETKVYGTDDPSLTIATTGLVDATVDGVAIDDTAATALTGALARVQFGTAAGEPMGDYAITQGTLAASNYAIAFVGNTLTITPAPLTVAANPQTKIYGTADPTLTDTPTGFVDTTVDGVTIDDTAATLLSGSLARAQADSVAGEPVGDYAITQGTLAANSNYTIEFTGGTLTINPAPLTVIANLQTKVYGTADPTLTDTATGFVNTTVDGVMINDTAASALTGHLSRTPGEAVAGGPYAITQGTLAANRNYTIAFTGSKLTITPASLTIAADPETKVYGLADPTLGYTASGFRFSDTAATVLTGSLARAAGETVSGSPYAIGQGTLTANGNYTIHFTGKSLSITPATPAVTVSDPGGTYTGAPIAATATVTGVGGTSTPDLEGVTPTLTYYAGTGISGTDLGSTAPSAAGTYTVVARFPGSGDYAAADSKPVTFAIAPVAATITLTSPSISPVYGQAVTFVATVNSAGSTPVGTVTFADGTTPLATVPLDGSGQAALTISTLSPGSHAITATYNGGTASLVVQSGTAAESVSPAATAIVLAPHSVLKGKKKLRAVELTAEIKPVGPGGGVPTGQVTFEFVKKHRKKVAVKTLGTAELSDGEATLTLKPNQVLKEPLTIVYSGDPDFMASTMSPPKLTKSGIR